MKEKEHFLSSKFAIVETDIHTIDRTKERLLAFQLTKKDYENVKKEFNSLSIGKDILKKQEILMQRTRKNTKEEKEIALKKLDEYIHSLSDIEINTDFFRQRKELGHSYKDANLDDDTQLSSQVRIMEIAIPEIVKKYAHNTDKLSHVLVSIIKVLLFDYRLIEKFKNEKTNLEIIKNINGIMDSILEVNHTKGLLNAIDDTMEQTDNVASATEELTASVTNILSTIKNVTSNTNKLLEDISSGQKEIETSLNDIVALNDGFSRTRGNINDLVTDIRNVSQIIELVKNISEQTTLLAINASIEASRAGEEGKGFSVIADEIRQLSEKTTESVEDITKVIKNVEEDTRRVDKNTEELFEELQGKTKRAQKSISTLDDITRQTKEVGNFARNMMEILDEQYMSTRKIKDFLDDVVKNSTIVETMAKKTGSSIYKVSQDIEKLRLRTTELIPDLRHKHFINIIKTEERLQHWWIYNSLLGYHTFLDSGELTNSESRFWEWYSRAKNNPAISVLRPFKELESKHLELYHLEEKIRFLITKNKTEEASKLTPELEKKAREISNLLAMIEKEL